MADIFFSGDLSRGPLKCVTYPIPASNAAPSARMVANSTLAIGDLPPTFGPEAD